MLELMKAGGWLMWPILACSVVAMAIVLERLWSLRRRRVMPAGLMAQVWQWQRDQALTPERIQALAQSSPLGRLLSAGLINRQHSREVMKEALNDVGRQVVADLERNLNTLGTIAAVSPLLGLLGTVFGMIDIFTVIIDAGVGTPGAPAGGISEALIPPAAGLTVAIPSLMFHGYFNGLVSRYALAMEEEALNLVEVIKGEREALPEGLA